MGWLKKLSGTKNRRGRADYPTVTSRLLPPRFPSQRRALVRSLRRLFRKREDSGLSLRPSLACRDPPDTEPAGSARCHPGQGRRKASRAPHRPAALPGEPVIVSYRGKFRPSGMVCAPISHTNSLPRGAGYRPLLIRVRKTRPAESTPASRDIAPSGRKDLRWRENAD